MTAQDLLRQRFATDPHRPRYHFLPPSNWMNDPNGFIQWQGQYHLFYQHNPSGPLSGNMSWGHAVSPDLMHWHDLPLALTPTPGGADEAGVFSGCMVNNDGTPTIVYTGTRGERCEVQTQCLATSRDDLLTWEKYAGNPVLASVPPEAGQTGDFRDPFVWKEADGWYMVLGSRIQGIGGVAFLYRSPNLIDWEYLHPLLIDDRGLGGSIWECPNFFPLGDQWVLLISTHNGIDTDTVVYFVGSYQNHVFTPTRQGVLDCGQLYAPLTTLDAQNRRLLMGWLREARPPQDMERAGWSGVQSIPRILSLDGQGRLCAAPVPELEAIRGAHSHAGAMELTGDVSVDSARLALDIEAEFLPQADGSCGIALLCSPDGSTRTEIAYDAASGRLVVRQITDSAAAITLHQCPHDLAPGEALRLRVLLDGSVIETIANERTSVTSRVYARRADDSGLRVFGANARLLSLDSWEMPSIWS